MKLDSIIRTAFYAIIVLVVIISLISKVWLSGSSVSQESGVSIGLIISYVLLGLAAVGTIIASILNIIQNPKSGIKSLASIVLIIVIFFIGYAISKGELANGYERYGVETANFSKLIDAGLYLFYALISITVGGIIVTELISVIKGKK